MTGGSKTHFWGFKLQGFQFYIDIKWCRGREGNCENIFSKWVPLLCIRKMLVGSNCFLWTYQPKNYQKLSKTQQYENKYLSKPQHGWRTQGPEGKLIFPFLSFTLHSTVYPDPHSSHDWLDFIVTVVVESGNSGAGQERRKFSMVGCGGCGGHPLILTHQPDGRG